MKAKSKRFSSVTAFSGLEFVRYEWRDVPIGFEDEAQRNPFLELQEDAPVEPETTPEPTPEDAPVKRGRRGSK